MRFSIIIPVYKVEKYLTQCVDSVLSQSLGDYEVILVDDGSPDACPQICDEYAANDNRIRVVHKPNGGLSDARNAGLDLALGDFVLFLDSDDLWADKDTLTKINKAISQSEAQIVIFGMKKYFDRENRMEETATSYTSGVSGSVSAESLMLHNAYLACACDKAVSRQLIDNNNFRFVKGQKSEDIEWCCRLLLNNPTFAVVDEALYVYRKQVATSITSNVGQKNIRDISGTVAQYAEHRDSEPLLHFLANQYVLLITNLMRLPKAERAEFEPTVRQYWWLLKYDHYPYVRKVAKVKFLGYNAVKRLLRLYYKTRR